MIPALAPVIPGALSKKRDTGVAGKSGIGSLLDADGDGSFYLTAGAVLRKETSVRPFFLKFFVKYVK